MCSTSTSGCGFWKSTMTTDQDAYTEAGDAMETRDWLADLKSGDSPEKEIRIQWAAQNVVNAWVESGEDGRSEAVKAAMKILAEALR